MKYKTLPKTRAITLTWVQKPYLPLLLFCLSLLLIRLWFRGQILELDEAEQVFFAVKWQIGYAGQPPLYSWLQYAFFQAFGVNLFSLACLKYSLLFATLYYYHQICQNYSANGLIAWAATVSWALIPSISFDLLKDNTHSVLALFLSCLTWYWFNTKSEIPKLIWYLRLGLVIGAGLLSKFNYAIFLLIFSLSVVSLQESRAKIMTPYILVTLLLAAILVFPYAQWLISHTAVGLSSFYKIAPVTKTRLHGLLAFLQAISFFAIPVIVLFGLFFRNALLAGLKQAPALLKSYHIIALPACIVLVLLFGFTNFETRWLIPIFFLMPSVFFSKLSGSQSSSSTVAAEIKFIIFCLIVESMLIIFLVYRSNFGEHYRQKISMLTQIQDIASQSHLDAVVSNSYLILGNLSRQENMAGLHLLTPMQLYFERNVMPKGRVLFFWLGGNKPLWLDITFKWYKRNVSNLIQKPYYGLALSQEFPLARTADT